MRHVKTIILSLVFISVATRLPAQSYSVQYHPLQQANAVRTDLFQKTDSIMMSLTSRFEPYAANRWNMHVNAHQNHWTMVHANETGPHLIDMSPFKCGPYMVPDPPPLFYEPLENMSLGGCLVNTLIDILFF